MAGPRRYYVTTPIYYVNDKPHIGHAYCTVLADVMRRYKRLFGFETYFLTGTDEHGQKVATAARNRGISPQEHCDELHQAFRELWPDLHVEHDDFIRTTEDRHRRVVQWALQKVYDAGDVYLQEYEGWYSMAAERFWTEKDLVDGRCPDTGQEVEWITEKNYFFRMSKYGERLRTYIEEHEDFIRPPHRANEVLGFLDKGLEDLCISRPKERLAWGIELPFDDQYVTYVWFDALLNYVTALGVLDDEEKFRRWWPHAHHLIGKDILTTHCVYWTTMLMALDLPLPRSITATGWWLQDRRKMSKSVGNVVSPLGMKDVYGADVLRYFLVRDMVIGLDANFSEAALVRRNNADLANDLGNLARRAGGLVNKYFDGKVPEPGPRGEAEEAIVGRAEALRDDVPRLVDGLKLHGAIEETLQFVRGLNKYVSETEPYKTAKTDPDAAARNLYTVLEGLRHAAWLLYPVMPEKMPELLTSIGADPTPRTLEELRWGGLEPGAALRMDRALFPRVDAPEVHEAAKKDRKKPPKNKPAAEKQPKGKGPDTIAFEDFTRVELRVGTVRVCEPVEGADKLLRFEVDLDGETRQVVSGIAEHFDPAELPGTQVVVVVNLAPRKIFGVESQGMILTAEDADGRLVLVRPADAVAAGSGVG